MRLRSNATSATHKIASGRSITRIWPTFRNGRMTPNTHYDGDDDDDDERIYVRVHCVGRNVVRKKS